ncbi:MAG: hypothetical protein PHG35_02090 [Dehalococcoidales bacterium]|nr:hypothetical protein [Dehalococcoidales bacterium]
MKALSVKPPWAQFIIFGIPVMEAVNNADGSQSVKYSGKGIYKDVENRSWPVGRHSQHGPYSSYHRANFKIELPQRIYIHASKKEDKFEDVLEFCCRKLRLPPGIILTMSSPLLGRGAIIGEVDIVDCVTDSKSAWAVSGQYHFILANPQGYKEPVACRGQLGFFDIPEATVTEINALKEKWSTKPNTNCAPV